MENKYVLKGGEFLVRSSKAEDVFIPEDLMKNRK